MAAEDIQVMRIGAVDMVGRRVQVVRRIGPVRIRRWVSVKGTPVEWWFMHSRIYCVWLFVRERPRSLRRELSVDSLYALEDIHRILAERPLTFRAGRGIIRVANVADVHNLNRLNLGREST